MHYLMSQPQKTYLYHRILVISIVFTTFVLQYISDDCDAGRYK